MNGLFGSITAVPEPSSLALFVLGGVVVGAIKLPKQRRDASGIAPVGLRFELLDD